MIEVLSPSTAAFDRGAKFEGYRSIPSLEEYALVSVEDRKVDHFIRGNDPSTWVFRAFGATEPLPLPSLGVQVPLARIFEDLPEPRRSLVPVRRTAS